uniref:XK-related protein n=1 Tax=Sphenodon punctatus TaxID=8508 RepID=A0A8D0GIF5_SPHPU
MENAGCAPARPPSRYGCWNLFFALTSTVAFLLDLGTDLWMAARYMQAGHYLWGALVLGTLGLSSLAMQLLSWAWYQSDPPLPPERRRDGVSNAGLALLHVLQLGYLYRCLHALKEGWRECRSEAASETKHGYAAFLSHDISMLRLFETFLESAPQLTLVLYVILSTNKVEISQGLGICTSFLCIAWSLLDYHKSLRDFLRDKQKLSFISSTLFFLWSLLLVCPRILVLALFAAFFQFYIAVHFLCVWTAMLLWVWCQGTNFMESRAWEWLYRAGVAVILYFCWFNVAPGKTCCRSTIYHGFIFLDSAILALSWFCVGDSYQLPVLLTALPCYVLGLVVKCTYYKWFHPTMQAKFQAEDEVAYDEVDHRNEEDVVFRQGPVPPSLVNRRMYTLSKNFYVDSPDGPSQANGALMRLPP